MLRLVVVFIAAVLACFSLADSRYAGIGLAAGIGVGVVFFFRAISSGRGLVDARLRAVPGTPRDPNSAISMGLGAAGIACSATANPHYPFAYRAFYAICGIGGCVIALIAAWRFRKHEANVVPTHRDS